MGCASQHALLDDVLVVLGPVLLGLNTLFEGLRLFFGYLGNLSENVSQRVKDSQVNMAPEAIYVCVLHCSLEL